MLNSSLKLMAFGSRFQPNCGARLLITIQVLPCKSSVRALANRPRQDSSKGALEVEARFARARDWQSVARLHQRLGRVDEKARERGERVARARLREILSSVGQKSERRGSALVEAAQQLHPSLLEAVALCAADQVKAKVPLTDIEVGLVLHSLGHRTRSVSSVALEAVNTIVEHVHERIDLFSRRALFMSVVGASLVNSCNMMGMWTTLESYFDAERLKGVRPQGLIDLAKAASQPSHRKHTKVLLSRLVKAFVLRLPDFTPPQAVIGLRAFSFAKTPIDKESLQEISEYFSRVSARLSNADLSRLAEALIGCSWTCLHLHEEILVRAASLELREVVALFHYAALSGKMDSRLLLRLNAAFPRLDFKHAHPKDIGHLLEVLSSRSVSTAEVAMKLGRELAIIISRRHKEFSSGLRARLVKSLGELQIDSVELLETLVDGIGFTWLSCDEFTWLVYGLSLTPNSRSIGRRELPKKVYDLQSAMLTIDQALLIACGLRRLCVLRQDWVTALAAHVQQEISQQMDRAVLLHTLLPLCVELSLLNADVRQPVEEICKVIHKDDLQSLPLPSVIRFLSCAFAQDVHPVQLLQVVFQASHLKGISRELAGMVLEMANIVDHQKLPIPALSLEMREHLKEKAGLFLAAETRRCLKDVSLLLGKNIIGSPVVTSGGIFVRSALVFDSARVCLSENINYDAPLRNSDEERQQSMQHVAVLIAPREKCDAISGLPLGYMRLSIRALSLLGWRVALISVVEWDNASDSDAYLLSRLSTFVETD